MKKRNPESRKSSSALGELMQEEEKSRRHGYQAIGEFMFWFSQLEFTIKARLAGALKLPDELFDAVVTPYDFASLCNVTMAVLIQQFPDSKKPIQSLFNRCRGLNDDRVRVAHGTWTLGRKGLTARHASRQSLTSKFYFENPDELVSLSKKTQQLMKEVLHIPNSKSPFTRAKASRRPARTASKRD